MNLNLSPSPISIEQQSKEDIDQNPFSCQFFYDSMQNHAAGYSDHQLYHHQQDGNFRCHGGSSPYDIKNKVETGIKLILWNKEDHHLPDPSHVMEKANYNPVKWVPSKIRLMQKKTKNSTQNRFTLNINSSVVNKIGEDQEIQESYSSETDLGSIISNNNPIRVCSDCNTTKTPLWRSGPKGPKTLCNACGIRQRKARRAAMAAASAEAISIAGVSTDDPPSIKMIKVKNKKKISEKWNASNFKKRCKTSATAAGSTPNGDIRKKLDLEDFLINLSKNLAFQLRVFPQDEKNAAILLMALSSGLVHG